MSPSLEGSERRHSDHDETTLDETLATDSVGREDTAPRYPEEEDEKPLLPTTTTIPVALEEDTVERSMGRRADLPLSPDEEEDVAVSVDAVAPPTLWAHPMFLPATAEAAMTPATLITVEQPTSSCTSSTMSSRSQRRKTSSTSSRAGAAGRASSSTTTEHSSSDGRETASREAAAVLVDLVPVASQFAPAPHSSSGSGVAKAPTMFGLPPWSSVSDEPAVALAEESTGAATISIHHGKGRDPGSIAGDGDAEEERHPLPPAASSTAHSSHSRDLDEDWDEAADDGEDHLTPPWRRTDTVEEAGATTCTVRTVAEPSVKDSGRRTLHPWDTVEQQHADVKDDDGVGSIVALQREEAERATAPTTTTTVTTTVPALRSLGAAPLSDWDETQQQQQQQVLSEGSLPQREDAPDAFSPMLPNPREVLSDNSAPTDDVEHPSHVGWSAMIPEAALHIAARQVAAESSGGSSLPTTTTTEGSSVVQQHGPRFNAATTPSTNSATYGSSKDINKLAATATSGPRQRPSVISVNAHPEQQNEKETSSVHPFDDPLRNIQTMLSESTDRAIPFPSQQRIHSSQQRVVVGADTGRLPHTNSTPSATSSSTLRILADGIALEVVADSTHPPTAAAADASSKASPISPKQPLQVAVNALSQENLRRPDSVMESSSGSFSRQHPPSPRRSGRKSTNTSGVKFGPDVVMEESNSAIWSPFASTDLGGGGPPNRPTSAVQQPDGQLENEKLDSKRDSLFATGAPVIGINPPNEDHERFAFDELEYKAREQLLSDLRKRMRRFLLRIAVETVENLTSPTEAELLTPFTPTIAPAGEGGSNQAKSSAFKGANPNKNHKPDRREQGNDEDDSYALQHAATRVVLNLPPRTSIVSLVEPPTIDEDGIGVIPPDTPTKTNDGENGEDEDESNRNRSPSSARPPSSQHNDMPTTSLSKHVSKSTLTQNSSALVDLHRLKRMIHAAKITNAERTIYFIPMYLQAEKRRKLVPVEALSRHFMNCARSQPDLEEADRLMSALEGLPDAMIDSKESFLSFIEERLAIIVQDYRAKFSDNVYKRWWDTLHLLSIVIFFTFTVTFNIVELRFDQGWFLIHLIVFHVFWLLDVVLHTQLYAMDHEGRMVKQFPAIIEQRKVPLIVDLFCLLPVDLILGAIGDRGRQFDSTSSVGDEHSVLFQVFFVFRLLKLLKVIRVSYLYELVNRDIITPQVVVFHFQIKKIVIGLTWIFMFLISCAGALCLIDEFRILREYGARQYPTMLDAVLAISVILAGSNAEFSVYVTEDKLLYICLSAMSMIGLGVMVGQLNRLVFSNSVTAENYELMRDTLSILQHYHVPKTIQREVLSYQMHALNDDVVRHMANLAQLPVEMQQEVLMYMKIDAISRVMLFEGASKECQALLASSLARIIVEPETNIVTCGDVGDEMYMIAHGYADVVIEATGRVVTTFKRGDCFGEMALVQRDAKRNATVRSLTYCDLWTLSKDSFLEALATFPAFRVTVEKAVQARQGDVKQLRESVAEVHRQLMQDHEEDLQTLQVEPPPPEPPLPTAAPFGHRGTIVVGAEDSAQQLAELISSTANRPGWMMRAQSLRNAPTAGTADPAAALISIRQIGSGDMVVERVSAADRAGGAGAGGLQKEVVPFFSNSTRQASTIFRSTSFGGDNQKLHRSMSHSGRRLPPRRQTNLNNNNNSNNLFGNSHISSNNNNNNNNTSAQQYLQQPLPGAVLHSSDEFLASDGLLSDGRSLGVTNGATGVVVATRGASSHSVIEVHPTASSPAHAQPSEGKGDDDDGGGAPLERIYTSESAPRWLSSESSADVTLPQLNPVVNKPSSDGEEQQKQQNSPPPQQQQRGKGLSPRPSSVSPAAVPQSNFLSPSYRSATPLSHPIGGAGGEEPPGGAGGGGSFLHYSHSHSGGSVSSNSTSHRRTSSGQLQQMHRQVMDVRVKLEQAKQALSGSTRLVPVFMKDNEGSEAQ